MGFKEKLEELRRKSNAEITASPPRSEAPEPLPETLPAGTKAYDNCGATYPDGARREGDQYIGRLVYDGGDEFPRGRMYAREIDWSSYHEARRSPPPAVGEMCEGNGSGNGALLRGEFVRFGFWCAGEPAAVILDDRGDERWCRRDSLRPVAAGKTLLPNGPAALAKKCLEEARKDVPSTTREDWEAFDKRHPGYDLAEVAYHSDEGIARKPICPECGERAYSILKDGCDACGMTTARREDRDALATLPTCLCGATIFRAFRVGGRDACAECAIGANALAVAGGSDVAVADVESIHPPSFPEDAWMDAQDGEI